MATLSTSDRYFAVGITEIIYIPTIVATTHIPTRAEITAGTIMTDEVADISGWTQQAGSIPLPNLGKRFTGNLPGRITVDSSSLTFYADLEGVDVRAVLPQDTVGYIAFMDGGDVAASKMDVYPIRVSSLGKVRSTGDQAGQITVMFAVTSEPAVDVAIPTVV